MDDVLLDRLSRSLVTLENLGPKLDDLLFPRQTPPDGGGVGGRPGPKPPLVVSIVDLKVEVESCLHFWATELSASCEQLEHTTAKDIGALALWLRRRLNELETVPWAEQAAIEIIDKAWLVEQTVAPTDTRETIEPPSEGTTRVIASWLKKLGHPLSRTSLCLYMEDGVLDYTVDQQGRKILRLEDAMNLAKRRNDQQSYISVHPVL